MRLRKMKKIIQKGKIKVIQKQIVKYYCDKCKKLTGTRENPKKTWYGGTLDMPTESHYCKKTCTEKR